MLSLDLKKLSGWVGQNITSWGISSTMKWKCRKMPIYEYDKTFALRIVTWSYSCLIKIIISYLKPYNCGGKWLLWNRNNYLKSWLFALDWNTWNYLIVYKLFVFDKNT